MSKFDTSGGYYAPAGYMRVNAGGSHEENPNGGVQVGMDEQGVPNMLEEGEPVYNDYVYSDNITADKDILEKHNIPTRYAGKLYSDIADKMVDEAAEMPLDPIANKGLEAMLVRLADAQEEQKAIEQQKELEEELSKLSPEELAELEQMLAEQEQAQVMRQEQPMAQEMPQGMPVDAEQQMMAQQPIMQEQPEMQMPMMANGGFLRVYRPGGYLGDDDEKQKATQGDAGTAGKGTSGTRDTELDDATTAQKVADAVIPGAYNLLQGDFGGFGRRLANDIYNGVNEYGATYLMTPGPMARASRNARVVEPLMDEAFEQISKQTGRVAGRAERRLARAEAREAERLAAQQSGKSRFRRKRDKELKHWGNMFWDPTWVGGRYVQKHAIPWNQFTGQAGVGFWPRVGTTLGNTGRALRNGAVYVGGAVPAAPAIGLGFKAIDGIVDVGRSWANAPSNSEYEAAKASDPFANAHVRANGGLLNMYWPGGPVRYNRVQWPYENAYNQFGEPIYNGTDEAITPIIPYGDEAGAFIVKPITGPSYPQDPHYNEGVSGQVVSTGATSSKSSGKKVSNGQTGSGVRSRQTVRPTIPAATAVFVDPDAVLADDTVEILDPKLRADYLKKKGEGLVSRPQTLLQEVVNAEKARLTGQTRNDWADKAMQRETKALPTWPRYSKAITSGLLGLYNAFQEPYDWNIPRINPVLPYGRMHLIDPVYDYIDQNQAVNDVLAANAGTARLAANSGMGNTLGQTLLAMDYNAGRNIGNAETAIREANNQRKNAVIQAHNQNAGTLGNFHYGQNRDRAQILNTAALQNLQNALMKQRLRYEDENALAQAVSNQIDASATALMQMGDENARRNWLASNPAIDYGYGDNDIIYYKGKPYPRTPYWYGKCGGKMKK